MAWSRRTSVALCCAAMALLMGSATGCRMGSMFSRNLEAAGNSPRPVAKLTDPTRTDARVAVLWVGHATALVQLDDKFILTDPVFTDSVGQLSRRLVEPGIEPAHLPPIDAVLISHMHFDHLSLGSLELIERKVRWAVLPEGGLQYLTDFAFAADELSTWQSKRRDGLRITAVPVQHAGWRYALDAPWMDGARAGYVIEYRGLTVYFGGDTAYVPQYFRATAQRFPSIDLALLPIAPIHPREFMHSRHMDPHEALAAFQELGARWMVPIHFDTFVNSADAPGEARELLVSEVRRRGLDSRVTVLGVGEQRVFVAKPGSELAARSPTPPATQPPQPPAPSRVPGEVPR